MSLGPYTLVVVSPLVRDEFGDPVPGSSSTETVTGCALYPRGTTEGDSRTPTVITGMVALLPRMPAIGLGPRYTVSNGAVIYTVEGDVGEWKYFDGRLAGYQVALQRGTD